MASKQVRSGLGRTVVVQGFRPGPVAGSSSYVYLGIEDDSGEMLGAALSIEDANILGEYLRQEAEFAQTVREKGEE